MTIKQIKSLIERNFKVKIDTRARQRDIVYARALYFKLCRDMTLESMSKIGKLVNRDHSSVVHGVKLFDETISVYEPRYERFYRKIKEVAGKETIEEKMFKEEIQGIKSEIALLQDKCQEIEKLYIN